MGSWPVIQGDGILWPGKLTASRKESASPFLPNDENIKRKRVLRIKGNWGANVSLNTSQFAPPVTLHPELLMAAASTSEKAPENNFFPSPMKTTLLLEDIFPLDDYSKNATRVRIFL